MSTPASPDNEQALAQQVGQENANKIIGFKTALVGEGATGETRTNSDGSSITTYRGNDGTNTDFATIAPDGPTTISVGSTVVLTTANWQPNEMVTITWPEPLPLALQSDTAQLQALVADGDTLAGGDSLTGGGASVSDKQSALLLNTAEKYGASVATLADIRAALQIMSDNGPSSDELVALAVRMVLQDDPRRVELGLDSSSSAKDVLMMVRLDDLRGVDLVLRGTEKILALGSGTVRVGGVEGSMVVGDSSNQRIVGGFGSDTLVGGAGQDTLTGGSGADVFGFIKRGHFTITDFEKGVDKLAFDFAGITTKAQIQSYLTSVTEADGNVTFNFGSAASITLVGVSATGVGADLLFNIT